MRRAARTDDNQAEIVRALRDVGCSVQPLHAVGAGVPDLLVGRHGTTYLLEVKDGRKPPSARRLTRDEAAWHRNWRGHVEVVTTPEEALRAVGVEVAL